MKRFVYLITVLLGTSLTIFSGKYSADKSSSADKTNPKKLKSQDELENAFKMVVELNHAIYQNRRDQVERLIAKGANVNGSKVPDMDDYQVSFVVSGVIGKKELPLHVAGLLPGSSNNSFHNDSWNFYRENLVKKCPLWHSLQFDRPECAKLLLQAGAFARYEDDTESMTSLARAIQLGWPLDLLELLIKNGADINAQNAHGKTPLEIALDLVEYSEEKKRSSQERIFAVVRFLLRKGARLDLHSKESLLVKAVYQGVDVMRLLIDAGVDLDDVGEFKETALHSASRFAKPDIISYLVRRGASVNAKNNHGSTPLHEAVANSDKEDARLASVQILLKSGADIHRYNTQQCLMKKSGPRDRRDSRGFNLLLDSAMDKLVETPEGFTPFMAAVFYDIQTCVKAMIDHDLLFGPQDSLLLHQLALLQERKLHRLAFLQERKLFYRILKRGVRLDTMDARGRTPVHIFAQYKYLESFSGVIGYANSQSDQECVKECIRQSYALVVPSKDEVKNARERIFDYVRTVQGKFALPPYPAIQILLYLPQLDDDLCTLLLHELVSGNPSSCVLLSHAKEILAKKLVSKFGKFFAEALKNSAGGENEIVRARGGVYSAEPTDEEQLIVREQNQLDESWLTANIESLILEGIKGRFKQLSDRAK